MERLKDNVAVKLTYDENGLVLIKKDEIEKISQFARNDGFKLDYPLSSSQLALINEEFDLWNENIGSDDINKFFKTYKIKNCAVDLATYEIIEDRPLLLFCNDREFIQDNLNTLDYEYTFNFWDGSNYKRYFIEDITDDTITWFDGDIKWGCLDYYHNGIWSFQVSGNHAYCGKLDNNWIIKETSKLRSFMTSITVLENDAQLKAWFEEHNIVNQLKDYIEVNEIPVNPKPLHPKCKNCNYLNYMYSVKLHNCIAACETDCINQESVYQEDDV